MDSKEAGGTRSIAERPKTKTRKKKKAGTVDGKS